MPVAASAAALLALVVITVFRPRRRSPDEAGAVSLEQVVITGVLVLGALAVGTILGTKATDRANSIPTETPAVTTLTP